MSFLEESIILPVDQASPSPGPSPPRSEKSLVLTHFRASWHATVEMGKKTIFVESPESAKKVIRATCQLCEASGGSYSCVVTKGNNPKTFGDNATTALNHLAKKHGVTMDSPTPLEDLQSKSQPMTKMQVYRHIRKGVMRGFGYRVYDDKEYTKGLRFVVNAKSAVTLVEEASSQTLSHAAHILRHLRGYVSLVFDSGTIDGIQTLNCLIVHVDCGNVFLLASTQIHNSDAHSIAELIRAAIKRFDLLMVPHLPIAGLVCDNAPNYINACKLLRERESKTYAHILHFNCSCHILNLASKDIERYASSEINTESDDKFLLQNDFINRIVPTRWWCKLKEYLRLVGNHDEVQRLLAFNQGALIFSNVKKYIELTARVHVMARLLEKDTSNCVVAIWGFLQLINTDSAFVSLAVMNRYLKFYALNEVPLMMAVLCDDVLANMGRLRADTDFKMALTEALLPIIHRGRPSRDIAAEFHAFIESPPVTRANSVKTFKNHFALDGTYLMRRTCDQIHHIVSAEASSERSISQQKVIRNKRFRLSVERCEVEIILAFNKLPEDVVADPSPPPIAPSETRMTGGAYPHKAYFAPLGEDENSLLGKDEPEERVGQKRTRDDGFMSMIDELSGHHRPSVAEDKEDIKEWSKRVMAVTAADVLAFSPRDGQQVIVMWYWRLTQWERFEKGAEVRHHKDFSGKGAVCDSVIVSINRQSFTLTYVSKNDYDTHFRGSRKQTPQELSTMATKIEIARAFMLQMSLANRREEQPFGLTARNVVSAVFQWPNCLYKPKIETPRHTNKFEDEEGATGFEKFDANEDLDYDELGGADN